MDRKPYPSDLSDDEWQLIEPHIPSADPGGRPRETDMREVLNAIYYVLRSGCQWNMLPHDLPPKGTVYHYKITSNEGTEEVAFALDRPEDGWNRLGTFHFPADTATVMLTNMTNGSRVVADAVKWVPKD